MAYRGDVFPYVPVASELARRGHDVRFVVPREFHATLAGEPFRCVHSGTDFGPTELDEHGRYVARWGSRLGGAMLGRLYFGRFTIPHLDEMFEALDAEVAPADLVVSHPLASLVAAMACERRGTPWIVGDLFPMLVPSAASAPAGLPNLGARSNRLIWRVGRSRVWDRLAHAHDFRAYRRRLGLPADGWNLVDARLSPFLTIGLASPAYVDPQPDWPPGYRLTGFTTWPDAGAADLPADVVSFLDGGDPPVLVTLGTSAASAHDEVFLRIAEVLDSLGRRGVFLASNDRIATQLRACLTRRHGVWPFAPLAPLLGRCAAVVHAGGHGTVAQCLTAGTPSAITPCLVDQVWHARRHQQLDVGVWLRRANFAAGIGRVLSDEPLRQRARALAQRIGAEDGVRDACDAIDAFLAS